MEEEKKVIPYLERVVPTETHSFAIYRLQNSSFRIYYNNKEILNRKLLNKRSYYFKPYDKLKIVLNLDEIKKANEKIEIEEIKFQELEESGFAIIPVKVITRMKFKMGQVINFKIAPIKEIEAGYDRCPNKHKIEKDVTNNRYRLVGPNAGKFGIGDWISDSKEKKETTNPLDLIYITKGKKEDIEIKEMPIMFSRDKKLICIQEYADEPCCLIVGLRGSGKTLMLHTLADFAFWLWGIKIVLANDSFPETLSWCRPNDNSDMIFTLKKLGLEPRPLPIVYLYPSTNTLGKMKFDDEGVSVKTYLPWRVYLDNPDYFFSGKKDLILERSAHGLRRIYDDVERCKNIQEAISVVEMSIQDRGMVGRISNRFNTLDQEKIFDISNNASSKMRIKDLYDSSLIREYYPIPALMAVDLVPSLVTTHLIEKDYFPQYYAFILRDLFDNQSSDIHYEKNKIRVWLFIDEIHAITKTPVKHINTDEAIIRCATRGRNLRIGLVCAGQNYSDVPRQIQTQVNYLFCFRYNQHRELEMIKKDYNLSKKDVVEIESLNQHEFMALTNRTFVTYDLSTGERKEEKGPFIGRAIPPLSLHQKPRE